MPVNDSYIVLFLLSFSFRGLLKRWRAKYSVRRRWFAIYALSSDSINIVRRTDELICVIIQIDKKIERCGKTQVKESCSRFPILL